MCSGAATARKSENHLTCIFQLILLPKLALRAITECHYINIHYIYRNASIAVFVSDLERNNILLPVTFY